MKIQLVRLLLAVVLLGLPAARLGAAVTAHQYINSYTNSRSCTVCHIEAAAQVMHTVHWRWDYTDPVNGKKLGKKNVINNYCIALPSNEPRCTSCHIGWGYANGNFNFEDDKAVDCLVCHDTTGTYKKFPTASGYPVIGAAKEFPAGSGVMWTAPDLTAVARNVGRTSRATCGACHFYGGGGDAVKHGDLDSTMTNPTRETDIHMGVDGLNFRCATCHLPATAERLQVLGSPYTQAADATPLACENCHGSTPHKFKVDWVTPVFLNGHSAKVSCQTCHIPAFARGGKATKMTWDWSTAGVKNTNGTLKVIKDSAGNPLYDTQKGTFTWQANVMPQYTWFNGVVDFVTMDTPVSSNQLVTINQLMGSRNDGKSRIYPVKRFTGVQPYDAGQNIMAVPHLFPANTSDTNAYWRGYNWDRALMAGMASVNRTYSGQLGFVRTEAFWVQNHMVAPKEKALRCDDCHAPRGRFNFTSLGYPAELAFRLQTLFGFKFEAGMAGGEGDKPNLTFTTGPGYVYQVQSSTDLANWTDVPAARITGGATAAEVQWTAETMPSGSVFYRVIRLTQ